MHGNRSPVAIGTAGVGKITRDQHLPALVAQPGFTLAVCANLHSHVGGPPHYTTLNAMLADEPALQAISLCTPPQVRLAQARVTLAAGKHVMLEKPPGASVSEVVLPAELARQHCCTLFMPWHSHHAPGVEAAREQLARRAIVSVNVQWKEDVRRWHPNQAWIQEPGDLGVFDPGINALSILTRVLPYAFFLTGADLWAPANQQTPVAAHLALADVADMSIHAEFGWRHDAGELWQIDVAMRDGTLRFAQGGKQLAIDGAEIDVGPGREYSSLYTRFLELITSGGDDVDIRPLQHVVGVMLFNRHHLTDPFVPWGTPSSRSAIRAIPTRRQPCNANFAG